MDFRRILSPVDFSKTSVRAYEYAQALAERLGAELHVLHVYQLPTYMLPEGVYEVPIDLGADVLPRVREQLESFAKRHCTTKVTITTSIAEGIPYMEIVREATERKVDLIAIGTHGRTGLSHLLMGSVAERVVRTSDIPVLTIRLAE
jgi:nucleotide-binding universal stress UspA family protein